MCSKFPNTTKTSKTLLRSKLRGTIQQFQSTRNLPSGVSPKTFPKQMSRPSRRTNPKKRSKGAKGVCPGGRKLSCPNPRCKISKSKLKETKLICWMTTTMTTSKSYLNAILASCSSLPTTSLQCKRIRKINRPSIFWIERWTKNNSWKTN